MAAQKIGEITKFHHSVQELTFILKKICKILFNSDWRTRVASSLAIREICKQIPEYKPQNLVGDMPREIKKVKNLEKFSAFNVKNLLAVKPKLLKTYTTKKRKSNNDFFNSKKKRKINDGKVTIQHNEDENENLRLDQWTLYLIFENLLENLFHPVWYYRHGACLGLKEILKFHYSSAGKTVYFSNEMELKIQNFDFLEDCCVKILSVLSLDRFNDFKGDQITSPVREECAEILGIVIKGLSDLSLDNLLKCLVGMTECNEWEVRHGSLLGIKYCVVHHEKLVEKHLRNVLGFILNRLNDSSEDVKSLAAETLIPIASFIIKFVKKEELLKIIIFLWDSLKDYDDIVIYASNIMLLLSKFYSLVVVMEENDCVEVFFNNRLYGWIPRLLKFLRHNFMSVRKAAILTFENLVILNDFSKWLDVDQLLESFLRHVFQNAILEEDEEIQNISFRVWELIFTKANLEKVTKIIISKQLIGDWVSLISMNLEGTPKRFPQKYLLLCNSDFKNTSNMRLEFINEEEILKMRILSVKLIGIMVRKCPQSLGYTSKVIIQLLTSQWCTHKQISGLLIRELKETISVQIMNQLKSNINKKECNYSENNSEFTLFVNHCNQLMQFYKANKFSFQSFLDNNSGITITNSKELTEKYYFGCVEKLKNNSKQINSLNLLKKNVEQTRKLYNMKYLSAHYPTYAILSSVLVEFKNEIPENMNQILTSLFYCIKNLNETMQRICGKAVGMIFLHNKNTGNKLLDILSILLWNNRPDLEKIEVDETREVKKKKIGKKYRSFSKIAKQELEKETKKEITFRGVSITFNCIVEILGKTLFQHINLWDKTGKVILQKIPFNSPKFYENLIKAMFTLSIIVPTIDPIYHQQIVNLLEKLIFFLSIENTQEHSSHLISIITKVIRNESMEIIINKLVPILKETNDDIQKRGSIFTIYKIVKELRLEILPYVVMFVVPLLKRMSDFDPITRKLSSYCFAFVMKVLPLENISSNSSGFSSVKKQERKFLEQLIDNKKIEPFQVDNSLIVNVKLRNYQIEGISWLNFLRKFNIHGILCDDMGLGKTVQTICITGSDIIFKKEQYSQERKKENIHKPSLVICPATLIEHWADEYQKYCPIITFLKYCGAPEERRSFFQDFSKYDVIILSYTVCRNDVEILKTKTYNYVVLDEGHIIKNSKSKVSQAIKQLRSEHRLILSGTPIQNSVLELWSLFDFLMPGFLGTQREFNSKYSKPILASRNAKANSKEKQAGILALEDLHRQVLPFILRRLKEDVLDDLPPKIIQDYYCVLSDLQKRILYHFETKIEGDKDNSFSKLEFLRKMCNHPKMVQEDLGHSTNLYKEVSELPNNYIFSPKLKSLKQLLNDCGIGIDDDKNVSEVSQHRVLLFCEYQGTVNFIENVLLKKEMQTARYLRLDGTVVRKDRHSIVTKFNNDPSYDILLLTKRVGGLGLNLTGANVVIIFENSWNPAVDVQAMDRAHRLGTKKTVNVYRLICKDTIEEEMIGLQKFKQNLSNSIINEDNTRVDNMQTSNVMEKFEKDVVLDEDVEMKDNIDEIEDIIMV